jgi:hypothetical protein
VAKKSTIKPVLGGSLMFPNEYLGAEDLQGQDVTVTIASISQSDLRVESGGTESKFVMMFKGKKKKFVLNKTNAVAIAALHGKQADDWIGKRITLYPTTCPAFGAIVDCIRVRNRVPQETQPTQAEPQTQPEITDDELAGIID